MKLNLELESHIFCWEKVLVFWKLLGESLKKWQIINYNSDDICVGGNRNKRSDVIGMCDDMLH